MKRRLATQIPLFLTVAAGIAVAATDALAAAPAGLDPSAVAGGTNGAAPKIQFAEVEHDFGRLVAGQVMKYEFVFTNTGTGSLIIQDARSTCGCFMPANWTKRVEPGKTGIIPTEFHSSKFTGPVAKDVTVICNDPDRRQLALKVKATVWRPFEVTPGTASFSESPDALTNLVRTVRISNKQTVPLTLSEPRSNQRVFVCNLLTNQPGQEYQLVVKLVPPLGAGNVFGQITMRTSAPEMPLATVPVWVVAQPPVIVVPAKLPLPESPLPDRLTQTISFRNNWTNSLSVFDPVVNVKEVELSLTEIEKGDYFDLKVTFPRGFELRADSKPEVTVKSNHPGFPIIRIPVVPRLPAAGKAATPASVNQKS